MKKEIIEILKKHQAEVICRGEVITDGIDSDDYLDVAEEIVKLFDTHNKSANDILEVLWLLRHGKKFYFKAYGKDMINDLINNKTGYMTKEGLRTELKAFAKKLIDGYKDETTLLEILGTNDAIDDYIDNQLRERWKHLNKNTHISLGSHSDEYGNGF